MGAERAGRRRVWHLRATNFVGGPEKQILGHLVRLRDTGWEPTLALFGSDPGAEPLAARARADGLAVVRLAGTGGFDPRQLTSLRGALRRERADLLVTHGYRADLVGAAATALGGPAQIAFIRGFTGENRHVRLFERAQRLAIRRAAAVACVSSATAAAIVAGGIPASRVATVRNAVEVPAGPVRGPGAGSAAPLILAAGRLSPEKGHALLIDAFAALGRPDARLVIYGDGSLRHALGARAAARGVAGRVELAGFSATLPERIAEASVFVNPSSTEGLPNVVLEALSVGTPVVATAVGGVPELLGDVGCGRLVPPGDAAALSAAIGEALDDLPGERAAAAVGRDRLRRDWSFESQAARLVRLYDAVVADRFPAGAV